MGKPGGLFVYQIYNECIVMLGLSQATPKCATLAYLLFEFKLLQKQWCKKGTLTLLCPPGAGNKLPMRKVRSL